jgi:hypothetical protein
MGYFVMEKNLIIEYFEIFEVLDGAFSVCLTIDDVNVIMHSLRSLCV